MRAIGIIRVSQRDDGAQSPEGQARALLGLAARSAWALAPGDLWDENIDLNGRVRREASAGAQLADRPTFLQAVEAVERGEAQVICAERLDRLFRDLDVQREVISRVEAAGGQIETVAGRASHETAELELQANLSGSVAQYVKRTAIERSMAAVTQAIEQGKVPWSQTPPGYVRTADSTLRPDTAAKRRVAVKAFEIRDEGARIADVRAHLAAHGIARSYHGTQHLLRDRLYLGEIHFRGRVNLAAHEPIISRELFDRVQRVKVSRGPRPVSERLLARLGVLRCASCGARMTVGMQRQNGRAYPFYRCATPPVDCAARVTISAELIEGIVVDAAKAALDDLEGRASVQQDAVDAIAAAERAQAMLDDAFSAFAGLESEPAARSRLQALAAQRDEARELAQRLGGATAAATVTAADWDELTPEGRRDLIVALVDRVSVSPGRGAGRVQLQLLGEEDPGLAVKDALRVGTHAGR